MNILRQSTAVDIGMGPFVDSGDANTVEGSLTITQPDIRLKKNGGNWAQKSAAQTLSHEENGWYEVALSTTDTDTVGILLVAVHESGALPVWREFQVVEEAIYDALFAASATGLLPANVTQFGGSALTQSGGRPEVNASHWAGTAVGSANVLIDGAITAAKIASDAITAAKIAADAITAAKLASDVATEINAGVLAVLGALADAAADGDPTTSDTIVAYLKQLVNVLTGSAGIVTFPSAAAPANAVSMAEVLRQIYDEVAGLNGGGLLDAVGVRGAVGLGSANLDTQLGAIADVTAKLDEPADTIVRGSAITGTLSATQMSTDLTEATDDHYAGRTVIWTSGVLTNLQTKITAYDGTGKVLTYEATATGEAPSDGDDFIIV